MTIDKAALESLLGDAGKLRAYSDLPLRMRKYPVSDPRHARVLGISAYYHDSSVALVENGEVVFAGAEERFSRKKHDFSFPSRAIERCLDYCNLTFGQVDLVVFYEDPMLKLRRILTHNRDPEDLFLRRLGRQLTRGLMVENTLRRAGYEGPVEYALHHFSHAASAYYASPYNEAVILTVDGVGEYSTCCVYRGNGLEISHEQTVLDYPHSIGLLYSTITAFLGFRVNNDEYKVMGLASYGKPRYLEQFGKLTKSRDPLELDMKYFTHDRSDMSAYDEDRLVELFGIAPRKPESEIGDEHKDIASTLQKVTEEALCGIVAKLRKDFPEENLCMAGGVILNCVANERIAKEAGYRNIFIQPAAGDDGGSVGAALLGYYRCLGGTERPMKYYRTFLGPGFTEEQMKAVLDEEFVHYHRLEGEELFNWVAEKLTQKKVVAWYQDRMEFGPRALGNRSILANPLEPDMQDILNAKVKHRESFRPFAPAVLARAQKAYFDLPFDSPFMLYTTNVLREGLPAITHIDGSARIQSVSEKDNPRFHKLIEAFEKLTGVPVIVNTSFNVRGEPIVHTPREAFNCFFRTSIDILVMGNYVVEKENMGA